MRTKRKTTTDLPYRLSKTETATVLGFQNHDIPVLIKKKLLKPLGNPSEKAPKYFSKVEILENGSDRSWLNRATKAINDHWQDNHARRKKQ